MRVRHGDGRVGTGSVGEDARHPAPKLTNIVSSSKHNRMLPERKGQDGAAVCLAGIGDRVASHCTVLDSPRARAAILPVVTGPFDVLARATLLRDP